MEESIVDRLYSDTKELLDYLAAKGEPSFQTRVDDNVRKTLLLSAASYFESVIKDALVSFFGERTNQCALTVAFIQNKGLERQYHTLFTWDRNNANSFFGLFGPGFKDFMSAQVKNNPELEQSIQAFLRLGETRNHLVHGNFAVFPLERTSEQIYDLYKQAVIFVDLLPSKLREFAASQDIAVKAIGDAGE
jgi:RiboL-PSP-HEPN